LLGAALDYLAAERDVRGYDAEKGWMHSVAHTADLLKFLARSPRLATAGQQRILAAIAVKLESTGPLVDGEDERLARAILSLAGRSDFDAAAFRAWHSAYPARQKAWRRSLWAKAPAWSAPGLDPEGYAGIGNAKHLLASLYSLLAQVREPASALVTARDELLATLAQI
jgi:hypothetical protein